MQGDGEKFAAGLGVRACIRALVRAYERVHVCVCVCLGDEKRLAVCVCAVHYISMWR